ncbi:NUDIX hydrolase [bacterium]|nr:NUDIX hydrolase [candidate division CSSED10-310 bacterium]
MDRRLAAFGIITSEIDGERRFLLRWNQRWEWFNLVGGKYEQTDGDDLRATAVREIQDELDLVHNRDFVVDDRPVVKYTTQDVSRSDGQYKHYCFHIFKVTLVADPAELLGHLANNPANRWLTAADILARRTGDGFPISYLPRDILLRSGHIQESAADPSPRD